MTLKNGTYQIFSTSMHDSGKQLRLAVYNNYLLSVNDSSHLTVKVVHTSGNRFKITAIVAGPNLITPSTDFQRDKEVHLVEAGGAEWQITPATEGSEENFKVGIPDTKTFWRVPREAESKDHSAVVLDDVENYSGQIFVFVKKD